MCIYTQRDGDMIMFCSAGGIDIGDVDSKVSSIYCKNICTPFKLNFVICYRHADWVMSWLDIIIMDKLLICQLIGLPMVQKPFRLRLS